MDEVKNENLTNTSGTTTTSTTPSYVRSYDQQLSDVSDRYDKNLQAQKVNLENAYNQNVSNIEADNANIAKNYDTQMSQQTKNYEVERRNNNIQAINNGLNTGAGSQVNLALSNMYNSNLANIRTGKATAEAEGQRKLTDVKAEYQGNLNRAIADNDLAKANALADEYDKIRDQILADANAKSAVGDYSGYADVYGEEWVSQATQVWNMQNPLMAYNMGKISADQYYSYTGSYPPGYSVGGGGGWYGDYYQPDTNDYKYYDTGNGIYTLKDSSGNTVNLPGVDTYVTADNDSRGTYVPTGFKNR